MLEGQRLSDQDEFPEEQAGPAEEKLCGAAEQTLAEELAQVPSDQALLVQIARLIGLSRELRQGGYTGQVTLNFGNGLVNSVRRDHWTDWRKRSAGIVG